MVQVMKLVSLDPGLLVFPHYIHVASVCVEGEGNPSSPSDMISQTMM